MAKKKSENRRVDLTVRIGLACLFAVLVILLGMKLFKAGPFKERYTEREGSGIDSLRPDMQVKLLTQNRYSRPGTRTGKITGIVLHYTANPGSTAMQNRDYFEGLKDSHATSASSHFVVGIDGEIVQCVPTWEIAYASNDRNADTVSIETCHRSADGSYTRETYESMIKLSAWLCLKFDLTEEDVIRHYDVTGKICPKYFVENEAAWKRYRKDVGRELNKMSKELKKMSGS